MMIFRVFLGLFFIVIGFLVKAYPDTISGYNTMPKEKKKNVDIVGLSTFMKRGFVVTGVTVIVMSLFFEFFHQLMKYSTLAIIFVCLAGLIIVSINSRKFDGNRKKNILINNQNT